MFLWFLPRENVVKLWKKANSENIKNVIVTSSREDVAKAYLENVGLSHLCFHYTCINHVSKPKPSPIPYLQTVKQLNLKASNCIVIEDSISGNTFSKISRTIHNSLGKR